MRLTRLNRPRDARGRLRIGAAEFALLGDDLSAGVLGQMHLIDEDAVARDLLRRYRDRHGGEARPASAGPDRKAARALRQRAEPRAAGAVADVDVPDPAVGVVIFMSPVFATAAATKATVPLPMSKIPAFCLPPSS